MGFAGMGELGGKLPIPAKPISPNSQNQGVWNLKPYTQQVIRLSRATH